MSKVIPKDTSFTNIFEEINYEGLTLLDLWDAYDVITAYKGESKFYVQYQMPKNQRLDQMSEQLYGTPDLWWFVLLFNNIEDPFTAFDVDSVTGNEQIIDVIKPEFLQEILYAIKVAKANR